MPTLRVKIALLGINDLVTFIQPTIYNHKKTNEKCGKLSSLEEMIRLKR